MKRAYATLLFFFATSLAACSCNPSEMMGGDGSVNGNNNAGGDGAVNAGGDGAVTGNTNAGGDGAVNGGGDGTVTGNTTAGGDGAVNSGGDGTVTGNTTAGGDGAVNGGTNGGGDGSVVGCVPGTHCGGSPCLCEDCIDNDNDGRIDVGGDLECTSFLDQDEATFGTGIAGDNLDCRQDCFFDGNSGGGGNDCQIPTACIVADINDFNTRTSSNCMPLSPNPGTNEDCFMSQACKDDCLQYVPNGCDCYGCCEIRPGDGMIYNILIGSPCDTTMLQNGSYGNCIECIPNPDCRNTCGRCELCPGKTIDDLPCDCTNTCGVPDAGVDDSGTPIPIDTSVPPSDSGVPQLCENGISCLVVGDCPIDQPYVCFFGCCLLSGG